MALRVAKKRIVRNWPVLVPVAGDDGKRSEYNVHVDFEILPLAAEEGIRNDTDLLKRVILAWKEGDFQDEQGNTLPFNPETSTRCWGGKTSAPRWPWRMRRRAQDVRPQEKTRGRRPAVGRAVGWGAQAGSRLQTGARVGTAAGRDLEVAVARQQRGRLRALAGKRRRLGCGDAGAAMLAPRAAGGLRRPGLPAGPCPSPAHETGAARCAARGAGRLRRRGAAGVQQESLT